MKKWSDAKLKNVIPSVFYNLTLISRAQSWEDNLKTIMVTAGRYREKYSIQDYEALECAVSKRRGVIRDKLAISPNEPESDDLKFDVWGFINDILDGEETSDDSDWDFSSEILTGKYFSGKARTKRGATLILYYMRNADAWRHDCIYRSINKILKQKVKHMTLQNALKYAIRQKKNEILRAIAECNLDKSEESDNNDVNESNIYDVWSAGILTVKSLK